MGLLDDAKSGVSKWFEEQVAKNKAFKAAGGMGKSNPAMARSMGLLPATGLLEQEGDAAARADAAYGALRKEYGPLGLRPGDFVPFASGGLAIDDARLAAAKGNYGQAAGSLAGVIPVAGAVGKVVRKITGGKSSGVIDSVKREMIHTKKGRIPQTYAETEKFRDSFNAPMKKANLEIALGDSNVSPSRYIAASDDDLVSTLVDFRFSNHGDKNGFGGFSVDPKTGNTYEEAVFLAQKNGINMGRAFTIAKKKYPELAKEYGLLSDGPALSVGKADIDVSYRGSHSAPSAEFGAPLNDMTRGMYPDDFYSQNGLRYYGSGSDGEKEAFAIAQKVRGKPDAMVTAYRAVPKGAQSELNAGDWIAISKAYAKQHGESVLNGDYDIISQKVPAKHIYTNADSISEYGYDPTGLGLTGGTGSGTNTQNINRFETEADRRMAAAQRNAALPFEQGGLGLPADNTPMDRARAMGGIEGVHYSRTGADVQELDSGKYAISPFDAIGTHIGSKEAATQRFNTTRSAIEDPKGVSYPVVMLGNKELRNKDSQPMSEDALVNDLISRGAWDGTDYHKKNAELRKRYFSEYDRIPYINDVEDAGKVSYIVPPENIRSKFAAFDPMRRNESDLLALNGQKTGSGLLNPEITKATNRGLYRTMLDEEDKPSFPYGLIGK